MPELPEVETIVRELNAQVPGRAIEEVRVFRADALGGVPPAAFRAALLGRTLGRVRRRGKFLVFPLAPAGFLIGHLRMTGKFVLAPRSAPPAPHHRVWFDLSGARRLIFQDMRCFGTLALVGRLAESPALAALGLEPLSRRFTAAWLAVALARSRMPLKHWLMHQGHVAGLGNIYAAEILFRARLSPLARADGLSAAEVGRLHRATRQVLRQAIASNGTTISDYRRVDEKSGEFQNFLRVYGKGGQPCPVCRTPVQRIRQQQRSTFFCPTCQP